MKFIYYFFTVLFLTMCNPPNKSEWVRVISNGFENENSTFEKLFYLNNGKGFLLGKEIETQYDVKTESIDWSCKAVIYKTYDNGANWEIAFTLRDGVFSNYFLNGETVYFIFNSFDFYNNSDSSKVDKTLIFQTNFNGDTFIKIHEFIGTIRNFFYLKGKSYVTQVSNGNVKLFNLKNRNDELEEINTLNFPFYEEISDIKYNKIYFLTNSEKSNDYILDRLCKINLDKNNKMESLDFPFKFNAKKIALLENEQLVMGTFEKSIILYKIIDFNILKEVLCIDSNNKFPVSLEIYDNIILIILGERENGYIKYNYLSSIDLGKSWNSGVFPNDIYISPFSFFKHGQLKCFQVYSGTRDFFYKDF